MAYIDSSLHLDTSTPPLSKIFKIRVLYSYGFHTLRDDSVMALRSSSSCARKPGIGRQNVGPATTVNLLPPKAHSGRSLQVVDRY